MNLLNFGLGLAGMPEKTIAELNAQLPALERLAAVAKEAEPLLVKLGPYVQRAAPDIIAVTPLIQQLIAFAKAKNDGA
jgi:hypothetical protein